MKKQLAIGLTKLLQVASKLAGKNGSSLPGAYARKVYPGILKDLRTNVGRVIFITGTNGKTTTSNVLATILRENGLRIIHNGEGSNLAAGITTAFISPQNIAGTKSFDYAVIEIDEGSIARVIQEVRPDYFVFTNLFKDQVDRFGTEHDLANTLKDVLRDVDTTFLLNGNDPYVTHVATDQPRIFYEFAHDAFDFSTMKREANVTCPSCGGRLAYEHQLYANLGTFSCPSCDYAAGAPTYVVRDVSPGGVVINETTYRSSLEGGYNAYNVVAAVAMAKELGLSDADVQKGLDALAFEAGRMERIEKDGVTYLLNLAKNTAGLDMSVASISTLPGRKHVYLGVNNTSYDGTDASWVNEANYGVLQTDDVERIFCGGSCADVVKRALLDAGVPESKITTHEGSTLPDALGRDVDSVLVIPNYTLLTPVRKQLTGE